MFLRNKCNFNKLFLFCSYCDSILDVYELLMLNNLLFVGLYVRFYCLGVIGLS